VSGRLGKEARPTHPTKAILPALLARADEVIERRLPPREMRVAC
jgi:hypothetical protein